MFLNVDRSFPKLRAGSCKSTFCLLNSYSCFVPQVRIIHLPCAPPLHFMKRQPKQIDSRATSHNDKPIHFTRHLASPMLAARIISHSLRPQFAHQIALLLDRPGVGKRKGNPQSFRPYSSPIIRLKWYFNMAVNITGPVIHYLVIPFNGLHARVIHRSMQKLVDTNNDNSIMFGNTFHGQALLWLP